MCVPSLSSCIIRIWGQILTLLGSSIAGRLLPETNPPINKHRVPCHGNFRVVLRKVTKKTRRTLLFSSNLNCSSSFRNMFYINVHCWCFLMSSSSTLCSNTCQSGSPTQKINKKNKQIQSFTVSFHLFHLGFFTWKGVSVNLWPFNHPTSPTVGHGDPTGALYLMHLPWLLLIGAQDVPKGTKKSISHLR